MAVITARLQKVIDSVNYFLDNYPEVENKKLSIYISHGEVAKIEEVIRNHPKGADFHIVEGLQMRGSLIQHYGICHK